MYMVDTIAKYDSFTADRIEVTEVKHLGDFKLLVQFNDGNKRVVDLSGFLSKVRGYLTKYRKLQNFNQYRIVNGNVSWGKDRDLIFPIEQLYAGHVE
jgi:hypothetical protein